jgi:hypothetical protein
MIYAVQRAVTIALAIVISHLILHAIGVYR